MYTNFYNISALCGQLFVHPSIAYDSTNRWRIPKYGSESKV